MKDVYDADDFWSIDKLLPKKKSSLSTFSTSEKTVSVFVPGENSDSKREECKLTFDLYKLTPPPIILPRGAIALREIPL